MITANSIDAVLKRKWFAEGMVNNIADTRINIIFVWRGKDNYAHITEMNGDFSVSQMDKIILGTLRERLAHKYQYIYPFEQQLAVVHKDTLFGCIDRKGTEVIAPGYDNIYRFCESMAIASRNGKFGYVAHHAVIPCIYDWAPEWCSHCPTG